MEKRPEKMRDFSNVSIESERLALKPISFDYDREIFTEFNDNVTKYLRQGPNENLEAVNNFIRTSIEETKTGERLRLMVMSKKGEFLGLASIEHTDRRTPEFGLWLKEAAQGQGFGQELIIALAEWANDNLDFDYLRYRAATENPGSWKIAEKLVEIYGGEFVGESLEALRDGKTKSKEYHIFPKNS